MRKCKTISFDLTDAFERELLEHAEAGGKFSKYIKRLIQKDKEGAFAAAIQPHPMQMDDPDDNAIDTFL